ncbi:MAG: hypothetical protein CMJ80_17690 [Planctomycetaceae bacterium]|nr:hypothetical protein [Planctomycetaceae bacterium]
MNNLARLLLRGDGELALFARVFFQVGFNLDPNLRLHRRCKLGVHQPKCCFVFFDYTGRSLTTSCIFLLLI